MLKQMLAFFLCIEIILSEHKFEKRALQSAHEKTKIEKWTNVILDKPTFFDQNTSLINLINVIIEKHLLDCSLGVLYDRFFEEGTLLQYLLKTIPIGLVHGKISTILDVDKYFIKDQINTCFNYILFVSDIAQANLFGFDNLNKIIIISKSSQWRVNEFLSSETAQKFVNLLVVSTSQKELNQEIPYVLYSHKLYVDGLGSSVPIILTSWRSGKLTRPQVVLFPDKIKNGFSGHRLFISLAPQPPFVIKNGLDENDDITWDGVEIRLINLLADLYNFTTDFRPTKTLSKASPGDMVTSTIKKGQATIGASGLYITFERSEYIDISYPHSHDCASFISLTSTALPRYRAIMGPFHWTVWLTLTIIYLFAIIPLAFSYKHTLLHLIEKPKDIENMFWYVFGTFTNCFSFGAESWVNSKKITTRILMVFYWIFTIIITSCYTGSIIAFITLPVYPSTVDTIDQLLSGHYQIGTLNIGGWEYWFKNSTDPATTKLFKFIEYLPTIEAGLRNITRAFFWPYAFLGSKAQLDYIVRTNFSTNNKRSLLHISSECFVPYGIGLVFAKNSIYKHIINRGILGIIQSGFMLKFQHDVEWNILRSATGKLLQVNSGSKLTYYAVEDQALSLDDTQGMFLLLGAGFIVGAASLLSEVLGGCVNCCKLRRAKTTTSIRCNPRNFNTPTARETMHAIQYNFKYENVFDDNKRENYNSLVDLLVPNDSEDIDYESELNKIFNLDDIFGEENYDTDVSNEDFDYRHSGEIEFTH